MLRRSCRRLLLPARLGCLLLLVAHLRPPPACALQRPELSECFKVNGADYRGRQSHTSLTEGGRPCLYWNQTSQHTYNTAKYPNGELGLGNHNYCRNPDGDVQPWCYVSETEEGVYWKYCDIPSCHMPGYLGCFLDTGNPPALGGSSGTSNKLTVQVCIRFCRRKGYKYAGVEAGYACFCGNDVDMERHQPVSAVECDQVCFGKSSQLCGGDGRIGIYNVSVGACEGNATESAGVIYSPDFPDDYGADSNCTWEVRASDSAALEVTFKLFEVRDRNDRLELRDGHSRLLLGRFDGGHRPEAVMLLHTNYLIVTFRSDQIFHAQGFAMAYRGVQNGWTPEQWEAQTDSSGDSLLAPTSTHRLNSSWTLTSQDSVRSTGAWAMYTGTAAFLVILVVASFRLRKRTCLYIQKKNKEGAFTVNGPVTRCSCPGSEPWSVAYKHTKVVICSKAGRVRDDHSDCSCLYDSYKNLSDTNQTSLKSLISTI
ncbi:hypothetical protein NDU88_004518 [Pleurodeles waltl]|uniref:Kringle-containing protein marking the eye and the nose n=1 Tax=Pleurodeles waltl TaxID=8319 RepID=A0AAV7PGZ2_PLEWA|nr:hypothetical protein NDU88_004518 [Pleurodeles waltl]